MDGSHKASCPQRVLDSGDGSSGELFLSPQPALPNDYASIALRLYDYQQEREQQLRGAERTMEYSPPQLVGVYPNDSCTDSAWERRVDSGVLVGRWEAPLFGCCTDCVPNGCMAALCPCLALAQALHRMRVVRYARGWKALLLLALLELVTIAFETYKAVENGGVDTDTSYLDLDGESHDRFVVFLTNCYGGAVFMHLVFVVVLALLRLKVRRWLELPGCWCADCGLALACPCCAIAQIATQVKSYTPGTCGFGEPDVLPPFERR